MKLMNIKISKCFKIAVCDKMSAMIKVQWGAKLCKIMKCQENIDIDKSWY